MTYPSFSAGEVLTAADMNAVGLWEIESKTFTSQTSVSFDSCFTSNYDNYKILIQTDDPASSQTFTMRLRAAGADNTNNDYFRLVFGIAVAGTTNYSAQATSYLLGFAGTDSRYSADLTVMSPKLTQKTSIIGQGISNNSTFTGISQMSIGGWFNATTSFDGFSLLFGANTTGTARVYGIRN